MKHRIMSLLVACFDGMAGSHDFTDTHLTQETRKARDVYRHATCSNSQLIAVEAVQAYLMT